MYEIITRILIVFLASSLFGIQRQRANKPIGFGTFSYVAVGACALAITAIVLAPDNPLSLLSGIITGIGFLGAGALIKTTDKIFGFTSAASIWLFAVLGVVIGVGEYFIGFLLYLVVWTVLLIDKYLEKKGIGAYQKKIFVETNKVFPIEEVFDDKAVLSPKIRKLKLITMEIDNAKHRMLLNYHIEGDKETINKVVHLLVKEKWVQSCKIE